jgi:NADPH:quinone reductase-like Zn-dependent oxidoreductase
VKAFALDSFDAVPALRDDLPEPEPGDGEVLVRVRASSVNPVDGAIAAGMLRGAFEHEFPVVLGRDFAGVVERPGAGFDAGDEVFGFVRHADPVVHRGAWAELVVARDLIALKPDDVGFREAGAAALAGMTAIAGTGVLKLFHAHTLLLIGASGGVGSFAVQLAARNGAFTIAPGLPEDEDYLRDLGAELIDRDADVVEAVRERFPNGVNALFDVVSHSPEDFARHASVLKPGGKAASPLGAAGHAPGHFNVMGDANPDLARILGELISVGELRVPLQRSFDLARAGEALEAHSTTHVQGKIGIDVE